MRYFVDESKARAYVLVVVGVPETALAEARRTMSKLVLPRQRSVHFRKEGPRRKRAILNAVVGSKDAGITATVIDAGPGPEPEPQRRARCLSEMVAGLRREVAEVTLDKDESLVRTDREILIEASRRHGRYGDLSYLHRSRHEEPLLALPDTIAWCWPQGGDWRRRVAPVIVEERRA